MENRPPEDLLQQSEAGDPEAQDELGRFHAQRGPDPESRKTAAAWFRRAAEPGFAAAKHNLGVLYWKTGQGEAARNWFLAAARDGWLPSVFALGICASRTAKSKEPSTSTRLRPRVGIRLARCSRPSRLRPRNPGQL